VLTPDGDSIFLFDTTTVVRNITASYNTAYAMGAGVTGTPSSLFGMYTNTPIAAGYTPTGGTPADKTTITAMDWGGNLGVILGPDPAGSVLWETGIVVFASTQMGIEERTEKRTGTCRFIASYPVPARREILLSFALKKKGHVTLSIYNAAGQRVRLLEEGRREAGYHIAIWYGRDDDGNSLGNGVYFARLKLEGSTDTRKVLLLK
jgi:hypothetical protein